jgi:uncharacterized protein (TIGR02246 family)
MRNSVSIALVGAAAMSLTLGGCGKSGAGNGAASPDSVKQAIRADEAKWNKDVKAKDTEGLAGHYADDAYFIPPGAAPADGSTAIRQFYATARTDPAIDVQITGDKVDVANSGDMAYSRGHYTEKYTDKKTGKVMSGTGNYLAVYKKQDDGSWKIVADFASADPDSAKPVPPEKPATRAKMTSF